MLTRFWVKRDLDATIGVFFDGFSKLIVATGILYSIMHFDSSFVKGVVFPGIVVAVALFNLYFWWDAKKVSRETGNPNVTALPSGLTVTKMFLWLNAIMIPTYFSTQDPIMTWKVAVSANIISGLIFIVLGPLGKKLNTIVPKPALFGTLAGIAIVFLGVQVIVKMFNYGSLGLVTMLLFAGLYFGAVKYKFSPALTIIIIITALAWMTNVINPATVTENAKEIGFYFPGIHLNVFDGVWPHLEKVLPSVIAFSIMDIFTTLMGVEQAKEVGNDFSINRTLVMSGVLNVAGGFFGSPFSCGIYWGHNSWNAMGARTGYSFVLAIAYLIIGIGGLAGVITSVIPNIAVIPFVLFIAFNSVKQAFEANEAKYYPAVILAIMIGVIDMMFQQFQSLARAGVNAATEFYNPGMQGTTISVAGEHFKAARIEYTGYLSISSGAIFIALLFSSVFYFLIRGEYKNTALVCALATVISSVGLIHSTTLGFLPVPEYTLIYALATLCFLALGFKLDKKEQTH